MKSIICALFIIAFSLPDLSARLGETLDQCVQRYGKATHYGYQDETGAKSYDFWKNEINIVIWFVDGRAEKISYAKVGAGPFSEDELSYFLDANSNKLKWKEGEPKDIHRLWAREDGAVGDYQIKYGEQMTIKSPAFISLEKSKKAPRLRGF